jgi:hypothetical protein
VSDCLSAALPEERFVRADQNTEAGVLPSKELVAAMGQFNEEMGKAGVLLAAEGLHPSSKGARLQFFGGSAP